jgi:hypothetical protein
VPIIVLGIHQDGLSMRAEVTPEATTLHILGPCEDWHKEGALGGIKAMVATGCNPGDEGVGEGWHLVRVS